VRRDPLRQPPESACASRGITRVSRNPLGQGWRAKRSVSVQLPVDLSRFASKDTISKRCKEKIGPEYTLMKARNSIHCVFVAWRPAWSCAV